MPDEINFDVESATEATNGKAIEITTIDYSPEWKTVNCLDQAMKDIEGINTTYEELLAGIASHITELDSISDVDTPDVPHTSGESEEAADEPEVLDETTPQETGEESSTEEEEGEVKGEQKESGEQLEEETEEQSTGEEGEKPEEQQDQKENEEDPAEEKQPDQKPGENLTEETEDQPKPEEEKPEEKPDGQPETKPEEEPEQEPEKEEHQDPKPDPERKPQGGSHDKPEQTKPTLPPAPPKIVDTAVVKSEYAQFKLTSDPNDTNVFYLKEGTSVTIVDFNESNGLIKVQLSDGQEGWMTPESLNLKSNAVEISKAYVNVNVTKPVEMRFGTTENSPVITTLEHSKEFSVIGIDTETNMVKIRLESGIEGYVSGEYLQLRSNN